MTKSLIEVEIKQSVTIDIEHLTDQLEDWLVDEEMPGSDCTFGELQDADYERVLVAVCETILERYKD